MRINRWGNDGGRWPKYKLVIDDRVAGEIQRTMRDGNDRWYAGVGMVATSWATKEEAEAFLIEYNETERKREADQLRARLGGKPWGVGQIPPLRYTGQDRIQEPFAGLFWYAAWGSGTYFSSDGLYYPCQTSEAQLLAWRDGVEMKNIDSFDGYRATYLGD
jgi:hypothetical protein